MTDVQVSNARRIGFTAMALVISLVLTWHAYSLGWTRWFEDHPWDTGFISYYLMSVRGPSYVAPMPVLVVAILPMVLVSLARYLHPAKLSDPWVLWSGILFVGSIKFAYVRGGQHAFQIHDDILGPTPPEPTTDPWFPLPLILTTAFVIWGAWRRAVRDARVVTVEDAED